MSKTDTQKLVLRLCSVCELFFYILWQQDHLQKQEEQQIQQIFCKKLNKKHSDVAKGRIASRASFFEVIFEVMAEMDGGLLRCSLLLRECE
jgi:hypothetical protein